MSKKKHEVLEERLAGLLANYKNPEDLIGEEGLLKHLTKLVVERALEAELSEYLGHSNTRAQWSDTRVHQRPISSLQTDIGNRCGQRVA